MATGACDMRDSDSILLYPKGGPAQRRFSFFNRKSNSIPKGDPTMQSSRHIARILSAVLFIAACVLSAHAQITTGTVRGTVTDQNGAVVPGAKVTLTKKSTNISSTQVTSASGTFEFTNLLTGDDYSVSIEAPNFKTLLLTEVKVLSLIHI